VIGIDPGTRLTGYGIVDEQAGRLVHIDCGVIAPGSKLPLSERLLFISEQLDAVLKQFSPQAAAIEDVFFSRNWRSALKLGEARGVALAMLAKYHLPIQEFPPAQVKQTVVGFGRAEKHQVQQMVKMLLGLPEIPQEDAADALAVAICYHHGAAAIAKGWPG
jgi:crossover junction endodeoxyribonuclease RuvC